MKLLELKIRKNALKEEEEKKNKEKKEIEDAKKKLKQQEIKNYTENINKLYLPKINPYIKKELEDRIKNLEIIILIIKVI